MAIYEVRYSTLVISICKVEADSKAEAKEKVKDCDTITDMEIESDFQEILEIEEI